MRQDSAWVASRRGSTILSSSGYVQNLSRYYSIPVGERSAVISLFTCLSIRTNISRTTWPTFTEFFVHVTCGRNWLLLCRHRCDMLCTSCLWMTSRFPIWTVSSMPLCKFTGTGLAVGTASKLLFVPWRVRTPTLPLNHCEDAERDCRCFAIYFITRTVLCPKRANENQIHTIVVDICRNGATLIKPVSFWEGRL